jgi:cell wall-associated NlpC family hydrolase
VSESYLNRKCGEAILAGAGLRGVTLALREDIERDAVIAEARSWISTRFHHHAAVKGSGVDCAHLVAAVYTHCGVIDAPAIGFYTENWFQHETTERLQHAVAACCVPVDRPERGDLALFRFGHASAHAAIVTDWRGIIHADRTRMVVCEDYVDERGPLERRFTGWWSPKRWHPEAAP